MLEGEVCGVGYLGNLIDYLVRTEAQTWHVQAHPSEAFALGETAYLELPPARCLCLPAAAHEPAPALEPEEPEAATV